MRLARLALVLAALVSGLAPSVASARSTRDFTYSYEQVWLSVLRLVRVDYRFAVDEVDDDHGFVLFQYREYGRNHPASVELVRAPTPQGERIRVVLSLNGMPATAESRIMEDLVAKLRTSYGAPPTSETPDGGVAAQAMMPRLSPAPSRIPNDPPTPTRDTARTSPPDSTPPSSNRTDGVRPSGSDSAPNPEPAPAPGTGSVRLR